MKKGPPNKPGLNDRVKLRGRPETGVGQVDKINTEYNWCRVKWDSGNGPRICHLYELEKEE